MEAKRLEQVFSEKLGSAKLTAQEGSGLSNDMLWEKINKKKNSKEVVFRISRRVLLISAFGGTLAAAAMFSTFQYFATPGPQPVSTAVEMVPPIIKAEMQVDVVEEPEQETLPEPTAIAAKEESAPMMIQTAVLVPEVAAKPITEDTVRSEEDSKIELVEKAEKILSESNVESEVDSAERKVVYVKPKPITREATKVKYVKRKKSRK